MKINPPPEWLNEPLESLSEQQWELLCDRCGRCCVHKLEDESTGRIVYTRVACLLLDAETASCSNYPARTRLVSDCVTLTPKDAAAFAWLPSTCGYRLRAEGKPLPDWHPLISGRAESVCEAGVSVAGKTISEQYVHPSEWDRFVFDDD